MKKATILILFALTLSTTTLAEHWVTGASYDDYSETLSVDVTYLGGPDSQFELGPIRCGKSAPPSCSAQILHVKGQDDETEALQRVTLRFDLSKEEISPAYLELNPGNVYVGIGPLPAICPPPFDP